MVDETAELAALAGEVALAAGRRAVQVRRDGLAARLKPDLSLVTAADEASEALVTERLQAARPDIPVVGEETLARDDAAQVAADLAGQWAWVVDPIDGTFNFAGGHPAWCVAIGLLRRGRPVAGAVYFPDLGDELYVGDGRSVRVARGASRDAALAPVEPPPVLDPGLRPPFLMTFEVAFRRFALGDKLYPRITGCMVLNFLRVVLGQATAALTSAFVWDFAAPLAFAAGTDLGLFALDDEGATPVETLDGAVLDLRPDADRHLCRLQSHYLFARAEDLPLLRSQIAPLTR